MRPVNTDRQTFLDMQEHPENYSDEQLEAMMTELDREPDAATAWEKIEMKEKAQEPFFRRIAAIFLAAAFLGGLAWAISPFLTSPKAEDSQVAQVPTNPLPLGGGREEASLLSFSNLPLDSILCIISAHYGRAVCFRDTALQALRLSTVWDSEDSLAVFLGTLNEFDGLRLTDERDTIFVESLIVEDK